MKTSWFCLVSAAFMMGFFCCGCGSPVYQPATQIPPGFGAVYIYANPQAVQGPDKLTWNGKKLATLGPNQYLVHFAPPGTNTYGFRLGFNSRGGLVGQLVDHRDPDPTQIRVKEQKSYYMRLVGFGMGASLWRVEEHDATNEIKDCHIVKLEKAADGNHN